MSDKVAQFLAEVKSIDTEILNLMRKREVLFIDYGLESDGMTRKSVEFNEIRSIHFIDETAESVDHDDASETNLAFAAVTDSGIFRFEHQIISNDDGSLAGLSHPKMSLQNRLKLNMAFVEFAETDEGMKEQWDLASQLYHVHQLIRQFNHIIAAMPKLKVLQTAVSSLENKYMEFRGGFEDQVTLVNARKFFMAEQNMESVLRRAKNIDPETSDASQFEQLRTTVLDLGMYMLTYVVAVLPVYDAIDVNNATKAVDDIRKHIKTTMEVVKVL